MGGSHCGFHLHFPDNWNIEYFFVYLTAIHMSFLEKTSIQILCPFFNEIVWWGGWLLSCMISLHILDINTLSDLIFTNILSYSTSFLFIFWIILCAVWSFLIWGSPIAYFCFCCLCFGCQIQKTTTKKLIAKTNVKDLIDYVLF